MSLDIEMIGVLSSGIWPLVRLQTLYLLIGFIPNGMSDTIKSEHLLMTMTC